MTQTYVEMSLFEAAASDDPHFAEKYFWELAGPCAVPVLYDGLLWTRAEYSDTYRADCLIPSSPEGLLL